MLPFARLAEIFQSFSQLAPILVIGDIGIDKYTYGEVNRISPEAPVCVLEVTDEWYKLGLAANVTDNLYALGLKSTLAGVVGDDFHGQMLEDLLEENGLSTWGIMRVKERKTTFKERVTTRVQQICRIDYETKEEISSVEQNKLHGRVQEFLKTHSGVIIEDYAKGVLGHESCQRIIALSRREGKFVAVDPSRQAHALAYKGATLLKPNRIEAELLCKDLGHKEKDVSILAEILLEKLDLEKVVITLGAEGMAYLERDSNSGVTIVPTMAREVFDVSGAGDTSVSLLTACLLSGCTLAEACWWANLAASVVVGKRGTATVNRQELENYYQNLKLKDSSYVAAKTSGPHSAV